MSALFSNAGMQRLAEIVRPRLLCAFDFDGTLAPIVAQPEHARLPEEIRRHLILLSDYAPIAIITGRSLADIRGRLDFEPDFIIGNHGLEGLPGWESDAAQHNALCVGWRAQLDNALRASTFDPGVHLEDKGYSLSVHYRAVGNPDVAAVRLDALFATLQPVPRVVAGKYVFNLLPEQACHKGSALEQLMVTSGASSAVYVGDDVTDEDAFRLCRRDILSVRIEKSHDSAAEFFLPKPTDILHLLDDLIGRLHTLGATNWMQSVVASTA